jgi:predicted nucleotidyltransferase
MEKGVMENLDNPETRMRTLREYFERRDDIAFAFLFGSGAKGRARKEGDVDIAVYFWPEKGVEWENVKGRYEGEIEDVLMATGLVLETLLWVYRMNLWGIV